MAIPGRWLIPVLVAALLILAGCEGGYAIVRQGRNILSGTCGNEPSVAKAHCMEQEGVRKNDPDICESIKPLKDTKPEGLAENVNWAKTVDLYVYRCYDGIAQKRGDAKFCANLPLTVAESGDSRYIQYSCIAEVAAGNQDVRACRELSAELSAGRQRTDCLSYTRGAVEDLDCSKIDSSRRKYTCALSRAILLNDLAACAVLGDETSGASACQAEAQQSSDLRPQQ